MDPKISIIIPVYNVENYLAECLDSCICQTMSDIEIICIDDMSTDSSKDIIKSYVDKYPQKITAIMLEKKGGHGGALNAGIKAAKGAYLCFVDSDDYVDIHYCEEVYKKAVHEDLDLVFIDAYMVKGEKREYVNFITKPESWFSCGAYAVWLQIIRKKIIIENELFFPENTRAVDLAMTPLWKYYASKKEKINKPFYFYRVLGDSLSHSNDITKVIEPITKSLPYRRSEFKKRGLNEKLARQEGILIYWDVVVTLKRMLSENIQYSTDDLVRMRDAIGSVSNCSFYQSILSYYFSVAQRELVCDFMTNPESIKQKYQDKERFDALELQKGYGQNIEDELKKMVNKHKKKYGDCIGVWGAGQKGKAFISSIQKIENEVTLFDSHVKNILLCDKKLPVYDIDAPCLMAMNIIYITTDLYYLEISNAIRKINQECAIFSLPVELHKIACKKFNLLDTF